MNVMYHTFVGHKMTTSYVPQMYDIDKAIFCYLLDSEKNFTKYFW